jgi:hypothetical protein
MGGKYSIWVSELIFNNKEKKKLIGICIHDNDNEIVSVVNLGSGEYIYVSERTKMGFHFLMRDRKC